MNNGNGTIEEVLTGLRDSFRRLTPKGNAFYEFILRNGRSFTGQPLPARYAMRTPKYCYYNTYQLVRRSKSLRYCQGYVMASDIGIPLEHAWAIDRQDRVIDVTLQNVNSGTSRAGLSQYYGIVFERAALLPAWRNSGPLTDQYGAGRIEVWLEIDPGFKAYLEPGAGAV